MPLNFVQEALILEADSYGLTEQIKTNINTPNSNSETTSILYSPNKDREGMGALDASNHNKGTPKFSTETFISNDKS